MRRSFGDLGSAAVNGVGRESVEDTGRQKSAFEPVKFAAGERR
jgi:hypothetical protein